MKYVTSIERNARKESLLEGIEVGLSVKFGSEGLNLLSDISQIEDIQQLRKILEGIKTVTSVSELQQLYQPTTEG
jgi:hypothetical protein